MAEELLLRIFPGHDRDGVPESFECLELRPGDLLALVGPTGSGKSRLLADIEWLSEGDSPSGRRVELSGGGTASDRTEDSHQRVALLSQSMQFVLDLPVGQFLALHAKARKIADETLTRRVIEAACRLCGEPFGEETPLCALSGGQSRALMIADTAVLAAAPVVLVDEVENAGVDRRAAMDLLVSQDKIVLVATHDPLLALLAPRRVVLGRGGVRSLRERTPAETILLAELETLDARISLAREKLRQGLSPAEDG